MSFRARATLACASLILSAALHAAAPEHRITVELFETKPALDADFRDRVTDKIVAAIHKDGRAVVLDSREVAALWVPLSRVQRTPSAYDPSTVPKMGKLLAPNYLLSGTIYGEPSAFTVSLVLREIETGHPVGRTTRQWRRGAPLPDFIGAVAELLAFIPRPSPLPAGYLTVEVQPPVARVRLLHEAEPRDLPLHQLALRPGRYAIAVLPTSDLYEPSSTMWPLRRASAR